MDALPPLLPDPESGDARAEPPAQWSFFDRRHDLDALRATAMLLGIGLHAALAYITAPFWPVHDARNHAGFDVFFTAIHGFRMPLFFMISGFFTAMLWRKRGLPPLLKHRAKRILLPLVLFMVTIVPLQHFIVESIGRADPATSERNEPASPQNLWDAARRNDVKALKGFLVGKADINAPDPELHIPALNWAALNGSTEAARMLIAAGARVDVTTKDGSTPLSHAAFTGRAEIAALLIANGTDLNPLNQYRATPLDNTYSDWETIEWVGEFLRLKFDKESVMEGREAVRQLLREHGGRRERELAPAAAPDAESAGNVRSGGITERYLRFTEWPGFHKNLFEHLWFLWFLCVLIVPFLLYTFAARLLNWKGPPKGLFLSPLLLLWLVPLTMIPQWFHGLRDPSFGPDTSASLTPLPHVLVLYAVFFFFGALYFDHDDREGRLGRFWWLTLPAALILVYPAGMALTFAEEEHGLRLVAVMLQALYAWLMIFGLMGLFRKVCSRESRVLRYVSDSSYWLYVAHLPLIFVAQYLVKPLNAPAIVKFAIVCGAVTAVLLLTYDLFVRYTWLGTLLNGKRTRK